MEERRKEESREQEAMWQNMYSMAEDRATREREERIRLEESRQEELSKQGEKERSLVNRFKVIGDTCLKMWLRYLYIFIILKEF